MWWWGGGCGDVEGRCASIAPSIFLLPRSRSILPANRHHAASPPTPRGPSVSGRRTVICLFDERAVDKEFTMGRFHSSSRHGRRLCEHLCSHLTAPGLRDPGFPGG